MSLFPKDRPPETMDYLIIGLYAMMFWIMIPVYLLGKLVNWVFNRHPDEA